MGSTVLRVDGAVHSPRDFEVADLAALPAQIPDVGTLIPGRQGRAVRLRALLDATGLQPQATHITLHATDGDFAASVPLAAVLDQAVIVYQLGNAPLPPDQGGPMRFLIPEAEACAVGEVDACANVKFLGLIDVTDGPGKDTRPTTS